MTREVVKIDEDLCNGCGDCVPACHEGALQIVDGKARLISDLMCDGLGACIGHCPQGAITIEKREAEPYSETKVIEIMAKKGRNTLIAHLRHLKDHKETEYLKEGIKYLKENEEKLDLNLQEVLTEVHDEKNKHAMHQGACPGARTISFEKSVTHSMGEGTISNKSELMQWPVQMHLINPIASYFKSADVIIAADCVAYALGNFHQKYLKGKRLAIACPKLDEGLEIYVDKIKNLINDSEINSISVMIMQVPCCAGLLQMVKAAASNAQRKVPVKCTVVGLQGDILKEEWVTY